MIPLRNLVLIVALIAPACRTTTTSFIKDTSTWTEDDEDVCELAKQRTGMLYGSNESGMASGFATVKAAEIKAMERIVADYQQTYQAHGTQAKKKGLLRSQHYNCKICHIFFFDVSLIKLTSFPFMK